MLLLVALWLLIGLIVGALANGAGLRPQSWGEKYTWLSMLALSILSALIAGALSTLILGKFFSLPAALWISILSVALLPRLFQFAQQHRG